MWALCCLIWTFSSLSVRNSAARAPVSWSTAIKAFSWVKTDQNTLRQEGSQIILAQDVASQISENGQTINPKTVTNLLNRVGLKDYHCRQPGTGKAAYKFPSHDLLDSIMTNNLGGAYKEFGSQASHSSHSLTEQQSTCEESLGKCEESTAKCEESSGIGKKSCEASEASEACEEYRRGVISDTKILVQYVREHPGGTDIEDLRALCTPHIVKIFDTIIAKLKEKGDLFEPKPGKLEVLR